MRLDHLLSKETEEVGVALLLICQGQIKKRIMNWWLCAKRIAGEEIQNKNTSGGVCTKRIAFGEILNNKFLVAMRLGDTPVLIPNTMVKT